MNYSLEKNNNKNKILIIGISILFCTIILFFGATTAFLAQSKSETVGNIVSVDKVSLKYTDNSKYMKDNLIPAVEQDVPKFAMKNSYNDEKYTDDDICKFTDEYNACSLYEFTIENTIDAAQSLTVSMTPTLNQYNNLYFILYQGKANELKENSKVIEYNTKIEQDTIHFSNLNLVLKGNTSETYTIVFYIKNLDYAQDDLNKRFAASISVNSITTGYNVSTEVGEGCYESVKLDDGTYKLTRFNGINHQTGDIVEGCGVTKNGDYYSVTVPSTYGGHTISTLGNSLFYPMDLEEFDSSNITSMMLSPKHYYIKELKINEGITTIEDGMEFGEIEPLGDVNIGLLTFGGKNAATMQPLNEEGVKVTLPNSLKYLGNYAFNFTLMKEIKLPNNLEYIGNEAMAVNPYLTEIFIPASVKEIGEYAFMAGTNTNLEKVTFEDTQNNPSQLITIGNNAFSDTNFQTLIIPSSVKTIGDLAFAYNENLTKLTIKDTLDKPSQLTTIGESAFADTDLSYDGSSEEEYLQLPASITKIGSHAFTGMYGLPNLFAIRFKGTREQLDLLGTNWYNTTKTTVKAINE